MSTAVQSKLEYLIQLHTVMGVHGVQPKRALATKAKPFALLVNRLITSWHLRNLVQGVADHLFIPSP